MGPAGWLSTLGGTGRFCEAGPRCQGVFGTESSSALQGAFQNRQLAVTTINSTTTTDSPTPRVDESTFDLYVELEADDIATPEQLAVLDADKPAWRASLLRLLVDADEHLVAARRLQGEERDQVVADAEHLHRSLTAALQRLTGERRPGGPAVAGSSTPGAPTAGPEEIEPGVVRLQLSWEPGRVVAWACLLYTSDAADE